MNAYAPAAGDAILVDAQGLSCPLPVLRARKRLAEAPAGALLRVLATDPGSVEDFKAFCETTGSDLVESARDGEVYSYLIRKAG